MQINPADISPEVHQAKMRFGIIGNAPALIAAVTRAIQVAPIDLSVLIAGESGSGKEFFPKIIHSFSSRKHNKYIAVNCGAIPKGPLIQNFLGTKKEPLPVPFRRAKDILKKPMAALFSLMK